MGSLPNMMRSMLVIGLLVLGLLAIVPRVSHRDLPAVDVADKGAYVAEQTGWPVELPAGLGDGWVPTVATQSPLTDDVPTFTTVWTTPGGADIALKEAVNVTHGWITRSVNDGKRAGEVTIGARTWERYDAEARKQVTYVLRGAGKELTFAVTTTGSEDELKDFVAAFKRVTPADD
jgi:hypothetical protein